MRSSARRCARSRAAGASTWTASSRARSAAVLAAAQLCGRRRVGREQLGHAHRPQAMAAQPRQDRAQRADGLPAVVVHENDRARPDGAAHSGGDRVEVAGDRVAGVERPLHLDHAEVTRVAGHRGGRGAVGRAKQPDRLAGRVGGRGLPGGDLVACGGGRQTGQERVRVRVVAERAVGLLADRKRRTTRPTRKNVPWAPPRRSSFIARWVYGPGPSSKVSATIRPCRPPQNTGRPMRSARRSAARCAGTVGRRGAAGAGAGAGSRRWTTWTAGAPHPASGRRTAIASARRTQRQARRREGV